MKKKFILDTGKFTDKQTEMMIGLFCSVLGGKEMGDITLKSHVFTIEVETTEEETTEEETYKLYEDNIYVVGSHKVDINEKIRDEELFEYRIEDRKELINNLIGWIAECGRDSYGQNNKALMQQGMEMLMELEDDYIFSSISTNEYISRDDAEFNETCKQLIELTENL